MVAAVTRDVGRVPGVLGAVRLLSGAVYRRRVVVRRTYDPAVVSVVTGALVISLVGVAVAVCGTAAVVRGVDTVWSANGAHGEAGSRLVLRGLVALGLGVLLYVVGMWVGVLVTGGDGGG